jgi:hypothetical protein
MNSGLKSPVLAVGYNANFDTNAPQSKWGAFLNAF